ncbi:MAG: hypothetical protein WEB06_00170 [Actinomycetota bacterium]
MINPPGPPASQEPYSSDVPPPPPSFAPVKGRRLRPVLAIVLGVAMLGGVAAAVFLLRSSDEEKKVDSAGIPAGWTAHDISADGFRLGLPPGWQKVSHGEVDASLEALRQDNPDLAEQIEGQVAGSLNELVRFFAFDTRSPTLAEEFATNVNVVVEPLPAGVDFTQYLDANLSQLRQVPRVTVTVADDNIALPGGRAALIDSVFTLNSPRGDRVIAVRQYLFMKGNRGFVLSMTTTPGHASTYKPLWEQIAKTFEPL